jgi:CopY/TcrY family copper transport repressor
MKIKEQTITTSEWEVMRIVWTLGEATSNQITKLMEQKNSWAPSTTKTMISRLEKKGYLIDSGEPRNRVYMPTIKENDAMRETLEITIQSMCAMCVGTALAEVLQETDLSKNDIKKIRKVLKTKKETAPDEIACNCMPAEMEQA